MIDMNSSRPLYEQIKDNIIGDIQSGRYQPGARIPSERDLSEQLGVSRLTVNRAIKELVQAGILHVQIGKGTFISPITHNQTLDMLTGFTEEMRSRGHNTTSRVLRAEFITAPDDIARMLDVLPGTKLILLQRVRAADGEPMALETCNLVAARCPGILDRHDYARESLYQVLRKEFGLSLSHAEQTIEARQATRHEAALLDIKAGSPVLQMVRVTYASHTPVEYVRSTYRGDRYKFRVVLRQL